MNATKTLRRVEGTRPSHTHTCVTDDSPVHQWECNSAYCDDMHRTCPEHGGKEPIVQGYEPWRGR
jgi:hypothetical protein